MNEHPYCQLDFQHFVDDNPDYRALRDRLQPQAFGRVRSDGGTQTQRIRFRKPTIPEVNHVFARCHQHIHQSDKISQAKGFEEFVKLITLKLLSDKAVKEACPGLVAERWFDFPAERREVFPPLDLDARRLRPQPRGFDSVQELHG